MAFFRAARRAKTAAWIVTIMVLIAIFIVRQVPQPWRGVIDTGVVAGLAWGSISLIITAIRALVGHIAVADPELPAPV
jgi:uncharacterized membrane protein YkgB